jgi:type 1 fimbria pilin
VTDLIAIIVILLSLTVATTAATPATPGSTATATSDGQTAPQPLCKPATQNCPK